PRSKEKGRNLPRHCRLAVCHCNNKSNASAANSLGLTPARRNTDFEAPKFSVISIFIIRKSYMDSEAARTARESLELAFHMSNILDTGLDRQTLSVLISLCELGVNPEALAAVVKELRTDTSSSSSLPSSSSSLS
ncbi:hypothetical protein Ancab_038923, partial [Ancistrocladus abbreviatus]